MKKNAVLLTLMLVCFMCAACGDSPTKETPSKSASDGASGSASAASDAKSDFTLGETAVFKNLKFTATEIKESKGDSFLKADAGKIYVGVKFEIENISDESQSVSSMLSFTAYADDVKCSYSISAQSAFKDGTIDGDIAPGKKLVGWYGVEVPESWAKVEIEVSSDVFSGGTAKFVFNK